MKITISEIKVNPGRRPVNLEGINELARSISEIGLLNPITIDQEHTLVAGLHRLEAAKRLGWTEIECNVCALDALQTELAEIDENVVRTELSVIEYGELLERRKEIYESLHPETKAGQAQATGMNRAIGNNVSDKMSATLKSFAQDTADKLGVSPRTVERTVQMMNGLTEDAREVFRHFPNYKLMTFRLADKEKRNYALNDLKDRIVSHLGMVDDLSQNLWERFRDKFLEEVDCMSE